MKIHTMIPFSLLLLLSSPTSRADDSQSPASLPCDTAEHHQFDFWLGNWQVTGKDGKPQGSNKVMTILDNCVVSENWQSAQGGFVGKSYNFYDQQLKQWHQTWTDNKGGILFLDGQLQGNVMILKGSRPGKNGTKVLHQISYTPLSDGRVEQKWLSSNDEGQSWQEAFLGYYQK
jgi:hypothetical protein